MRQWLHSVYISMELFWISSSPGNRSNAIEAVCYPLEDIAQMMGLDSSKGVDVAQRIVQTVMLLRRILTTPLLMTSSSKGLKYSTSFVTWPFILTRYSTTVSGMLETFRGNRFLRVYLVGPCSLFTCYNHCALPHPDILYFWRLLAGSSTHLDRLCISMRSYANLVQDCLQFKTQGTIRI